MKLVSRTSAAPLLETIGIPYRIARMVAPVVPALELGAGLAILADVFLGVIIACGLSLTFVCVQLVNSFRDTPVKCNCFGSLDFGVPQAVTLARSVVLAVGAGLLVVMSVEDAPVGLSEPAPVASGVAVSIALTLAVSLLERV